MDSLVEFGGNISIVDVVSIDHVLQDRIEQTWKKKVKQKCTDDECLQHERETKLSDRRQHHTQGLINLMRIVMYKKQSVCFLSPKWDLIGFNS